MAPNYFEKHIKQWENNEKLDKLNVIQLFHRIPSIDLDKLWSILFTQDFDSFYTLKYNNVGKITELDIENKEDECGQIVLRTAKVVPHVSLIGSQIMQAYASLFGFNQEISYNTHQMKRMYTINMKNSKDEDIELYQADFINIPNLPEAGKNNNFNIHTWGNIRLYNNPKDSKSLILSSKIHIACDISSISQYSIAKYSINKIFFSVTKSSTDDVFKKMLFSSREYIEESNNQEN